jgi:uncharacterized membrane protein (UPF0127 family)
VRIDDRRVRWLLWVAVALVGVGLYAFVVRGASQPADPVLGGAAPSATQPELAPPGDPARVPLPGFSELAITVERPSGGGFLSWCLLAALNAQQRSKGLMTVKDLKGYSGMVFVYAEDSQNSFYMRNTPTPLSIAWIDAEGHVVSTADMAPCEDREGCPIYPSGGSYRMAIEVPQGHLPDLGIVAGSRTTISGGCAARPAA